MKNRSWWKSQWKWILLASLPPLIGATALAAVILLLPRERVTWTNLERLEPGMSRAEVETILGRAKDYSPGPAEQGVPAVAWMSRFRTGVPNTSTVIKPTHIWQGKKLTVWAVFDGDEVLDCYTYEPVGDDDDFDELVLQNAARHMFRSPRPILRP